MFRRNLAGSEDKPVTVSESMNHTLEKKHSKLGYKILKLWNANIQKVKHVPSKDVPRNYEVEY